MSTEERGQSAPPGDPAGPGEPTAGSTADTTAGTTAGTTGTGKPPNMLPGRARRRLGVERLLVRLVATGGIIGIGVAIGAIMVSQKAHGWIVGLVVAVVTVILSGILWSSRQL